MALDNPMEAWLRVGEARNRNRQQFNQDIASMGQSLGQGLGSLGQALEEKKKKAEWQKTINSMMNDPTLPPQMKALLPAMSQNPALMGQLGPEALKMSIPPKPTSPWRVVAGMLSKKGQPFQQNESTGEVRVVPLEATPSSGIGSAMAGVRKAQFTLQDLPSNQPPNTAGGAAYQVKVGARQGKNLIAREGSPQRTGLAGPDLVRAITRVAPTDEGMRLANFSDNLITRWSLFKQRITADPTAVDNPKMRKELYDIFDDMDKSATPFISNQLDNMVDAGFTVTPNMRKRELGLTLPDIPFVEGSQTGNASQLPPVGATFQGGKVTKVERVQ